VNSATGVAESASILTMVSAGPIGYTPVADDTIPAPMAHGSGLLSAPRRERSTDATGPSSPRSPICARPIATELVISRSISTVVMTGPAAEAPSSAASIGTPMKPVFGNAVVSAPNAASFRPTRGERVTATVPNTISIAAASHTAMTVVSINWLTGSDAPNRYSMHGRAKNST